MGVRGQQYRDAMRAVVAVFGSSAENFVFVGSCVLGLYMRPSGAPFRPTIDADVISTVAPWTVQEKQLADLCERGILVPDEKLLCRYHIQGKGVAVDVLSPEGRNVGGITEWFLKAAAHAKTFTLDDEVRVRAVAPPYFLATKLEAWCDRGEDVRSDKDAEDIVALATEVLNLADLVQHEGIAAGISALWHSALDARGLTLDHMPDLVSWHLHPIDAAEGDRVVASLLRCARGA